MEFPPVPPADTTRPGTPVTDLNPARAGHETNWRSQQR
jgi:hypothetical protein